MLHISSTTNPRFKLARSLLRRRDRHQNARILLEGMRLIQDSVSAGFPPALVLFDLTARDKLEQRLAQLDAAGVELASIEPALLAQLTDTVTPQGIVAIAPIPMIPPGDTGLSVLVDGIRDPGNLGTLLRTAAAVGADQVMTLPGVTDPWSPKVLRAAMGAHFRIAIREAETLAESEGWAGNAQRLLAAAQAELFYTDVDWVRPSLLIVGGEATGAGQSAQLSDLRSIAIPMAGGVESLNAAVAASVILFEAQRQRRAMRD